MPSPAVVYARKAQYLLLELALPGRVKTAAGVLLLDPAADRLCLKLRRDWNDLADPDDVQVLRLLEDDFRKYSRESGGEAFLNAIEDSFSGALRVTERENIIIADPDKAVKRAFERLVEGAGAHRRPALPVYSLRAAAGRFGEDMEVEPEGYAPVPEGMRADTDLFAAHVTGRSMEPAIPDGSLCVFRPYRGGSRDGRWMLVWNRGASAEGGEFTIKRYTSTKTHREDGAWEHAEIRLEPLNPEYDELLLNPDPDRYATIAEFLRVVTYEDW